jgi:hypothetical protein
MITNLNNNFFYTRNLNYTGMSHRREPVKRPPYPKKILSLTLSCHEPCRACGYHLARLSRLPSQFSLFLNPLAIGGITEVVRSLGIASPSGAATWFLVFGAMPTSYAPLFRCRYLLPSPPPQRPSSTHPHCFSHRTSPSRSLAPPPSLLSH